MIERGQMRRSSLHYALRIVLTVALAGIVVQVAASQPDDHPWSGTGTGTTTLVSDGTSGPAVFSYSQTGFSGSWRFSTVASSTRVVPLAWNYSGFHSFFQVRVGLDAFVTRGATTTTTPLVNAGPVNCCTPPSGGFTYSGTTSLSVQAGDTYGFAMRGSHGDRALMLRGTLTVDKAGVTDVTPPSASCDLGFNPSGKGKPNANAGFRQVNASDAGSGLTSLVITDGTFTSGQLTSGNHVKLTVAPGSAGSDVRPGPGVLTAKIKTSGQPSLVASDAAGNTITVPCGPLPPNGS
jgi:hypothetical protein